MSTNKRDDILAAALLLFVDRGYEGTTVPDIANKANVGTGTIYRYFDNKEHLINVLYQYWVERLEATISDGIIDANFSESINNPIDLREQFRNLIQKINIFARENMYALLFVDIHSGKHYLNEESQQKFIKVLDYLGRFAKEGKRQGVIIELPENALIAIVYGAFIYLYRIILAGELEESPELLASIEECCWNAIRVH